MVKYWPLAFFVTVIALAGCSTRLGNNLNSPSQIGLPVSRADNAANNAANPASPPEKDAAGYVRLSPENTRVTFIGSAWKSSHEGTFTQFAGRVELPTLDPKDCRMSIEINMDTLFTKIALLTRHLKDADFFDVAKYPTATFVSRTIEPSQEPCATHLVSGDFTIHGVKRSLSFPARFVISPTTFTFDATIHVRQSEFGMESAKKTTDDVPVTVAVRIQR